MKKLEFHEAADLFPMMEATDFQNFKDDIEKYGVHERIEVLDEKVVDGRNRYVACQELGIECPSVEIKTDDPIAYVLSKNLHRRHMTPSQLALVAGRARGHYDQQAEERQKAAIKERDEKGRAKATSGKVTGSGSDARDAAGKAVGISGKMVDLGTKVLKGTPALIKAVDEGRLSVTTAAALAGKDEKTQNEAAKAAKSSGGRYHNPKHKATGPVRLNDKADPNFHKTAAFAKACAECAITQLAAIKRSNPGREEAFTKVEKWIHT